jgi:hypothetical protein
VTRSGAEFVYRLGVRAEPDPVFHAAGGEVQLTDAIALLIEEGHPVHVVVHCGPRHHLGKPGGYLKAAVDFAFERDDYGPELRRWLVERLSLEESHEVCARRRRRNSNWA